MIYNMLFDTKCTAHPPQQPGGPAAAVLTLVKFISALLSVQLQSFFRLLISWLRRCCFLASASATNMIKPYYNLLYIS